MNVRDVRAGDVFVNPIDHDCIYLLATTFDDGTRILYNWINLVTGDAQEMTEPIDKTIAPEWIVMRGDLILQEPELTQDWKDIIEVAA